MKAGEHLIVKRAGYTHHGLYVGNDQVIHYEGPDMEQPLGLVSKVSLSSFSAGEEIRVQDYPFRAYDAGESVARAESRLGEELYNLFANNCEHFVVWCIMGMPFSKQVVAAGLPLSAYFSKLAMNPASKEALRQSLLKAGVGSSAIHGVFVKLGAMAGGGTATVGILSGTTATATAGFLALPAAPVLLPAAVVVGIGAWLASGGLDTVGEWCDDFADFGEEIFDEVVDFTEEVGEGIADFREEIVEGIFDFFTGG